MSKKKATKAHYGQYKTSARKETNKAKRLARQLKAHPNDTTNPLHSDYVKTEPHKEVKEKHENKFHPSVFDGKPRNHKKSPRKPRALAFFASVPISS